MLLCGSHANVHRKKGLRVNNFYAHEQYANPQNIPILTTQVPNVYTAQEQHTPLALSRGNFYALFTQTIENQEQAVRFDGMTGVSGLKVTEQSHITINSSGTYLISYSLTPAQETTQGDFVGLKINDSWITTSLHSLADNGIGINGTFLFDLQEGQILHMAVQAANPILLQAGNANATICILQVVSRT